MILITYTYPRLAKVSLIKPIVCVIVTTQLRTVESRPCLVVCSGDWFGWLVLPLAGIGGECAIVHHRVVVCLCQRWVGYEYKASPEFRSECAGTAGLVLDPWRSFF